jgi:hypothetical protein
MAVIEICALLALIDLIPIGLAIFISLGSLKEVLQNNHYLTEFATIVGKEMYYGAMGRYKKGAGICKH